jgi:hypothetical protein
MATSGLARTEAIAMSRKKAQPQATGRVTTVREALQSAAPRPDAATGTAVEKKNYAERLSRHLATCFANALRGSFPGIMPTETGEQHESPARTSKGTKKLDVNYSTPQLGLALGVSLKSINFRDRETDRYTKNYSRNDNELRAEATDYHQRQPYAVLVDVLFLPFDSCDDGNKSDDGISSFGAAVRYFRTRANRATHRDDIELFERFFVALYEPAGENEGHTVFFDVTRPPPRNRRPRIEEILTFEQVAAQITLTYDLRNDPPFVWAD